MSPEIKAQLAPHGSLRAAINMGNFLLVTGKAPNGDPDGVSPDMARAIAEKLGRTEASVAWKLKTLGRKARRMRYWCRSRRRRMS